MPIIPKEPDNKQRAGLDRKKQTPEQACQTGKSYEDVLPYLMSGEADDLSTEFTDGL
jgi:hypothetical protein